MSADRDIVVRSLTDPTTFGLLFHRHSVAIFRYAARRVGPDVAEDIMSETFVTAFQQRARFDRSYTDARPWLFGIATMVIRRYRATEVRVLRTVEASIAAFRESADLQEPLVDRLDAEQRLTRLAPAIADLPRRDRDTLLLYAWAELDYEGVATALGVPVGTVRSRLNRVRRKLAAAAAAEAEGPTVRTKSTEKREADGCLGERAQSAL